MTSPTTTNTRAAGAQIRDELGGQRDRQPTVLGVQVVDALTGVAMQAAECGCACCEINVNTIVAIVDLEG